MHAPTVHRAQFSPQKKKSGCYPICLLNHYSPSSGTLSKPAEMLMQLRRACSAHKSGSFKGQKGHGKPLISHLFLFVGAKMLCAKLFVSQVRRTCWFVAYCSLVLAKDQAIALTQHHLPACYLSTRAQT